MKKNRYNSPKCEIVEIQTIELMAATATYTISSKPSSSTTPAISDGGDTEENVEYSPW